MKKGLTPLRIPSTNSGSEMLVDTNTTEANYRSEASAEDQGSRAPLMPIMQTNNNLAAGADENLPSFKFRSRNRLFVFGQNKAPNQFVECAPRGSNSSTVDIDVDSSNSSSSENRSRFGWHEPKAQHVETDSSHGNLGIIRQSSNGCALEAAGTQEDLTNNSTNHHEGMVSETPTLVPKHVRNIQSASGLSTICSTEGYSAASSAKNFQMVLKQNFTQRHFEIEEDPTFWDDHNVQVIIRVRPLNAIEVAAQGRSRCVKQESAHSITWLGHPESRFTFDLVAGEKIDQEKLFKVAGVPMVENCIRGYNSCMFAYGQTGSGKTHTMLGDIDDSEQKLSPSRGMTPRVFEHLFERIRKEEGVRAEENLKYICKCSFLEIYNEQVADLLEPSSTNLQMREDAKKGVYVENLREVEVQGVHDVIHLLLQGASNRKVAATNMNLASSRSHSVFTCVIESKWVSQSVTHHRYGRLHLVDLAGSERQKSSGAEGERLKEATNINRSLSTLGLVIMNLVNISNGKSLHVPYRDSKLTFLLQDSLGGNSKTIIIANVSPSNCCAMETLSTLKFAQRAKFIRNNATVNEDATGDVLTLKSQIQQLKEENNRLRAQLKASSSQEDGYCSIGSPGMGTSHSKELTSPLYGHKKGPQQRDMEKSLHGALKRGQDLESLNKALTAENDLLKRSISRLEDDAQCKKMFLRFREDRIKRLEDVASDKLSAEEHLLEEKNELLQELQMTRNSLTKNPIVTNFAMNNIRLQEQLRRYQEFYDHGEREELAAQIQLLSMQLFEALEWKLMHGENIQKEQASETDVTLTSGDTSSLEQAEQYRREAESLRNNLSFCLDTKEKLERRVEDLMAEIETLKANFDAGKLSDTNSEVYGTEMQQEISVKEGLSTERDLKDLIEAISAASQREAEIQSANIHLQRDLEDIRNKLEQSVVDNERLNRMYQKVLQEREEIISREDDLMVSLENAQGRIVSLNEEIERRLQKNNDGSANADEVNSIAFLRNKLEECESKLKETCQENEIILKRFQAACQERDDAVQRLKEFPGISACHEYMAVTNVATEVNDNGVGNEPTDARAEAEVRRLRCEVEEFKAKLKELFEENEKWAEMYEKAMQEKEYVIGRKIMNDNAPVNKASTLNSDSKCDSVLQEKSTQPESLLVEDGSDGGRVACDAEEQASIELCYLLDRMNINSQENVAELHLPVSDLMSDKDFELHKQKIIVEIQKIHAGLGNMVHNNAKLFQMYQKAATQRNELVKLWQTLAKPLEHVKCTKILPDDKLQQVLCALQKVIENPGFASVMNEFQGLEFRAAEALYSSSLEHSESDETLHLLSKVINEIYLALAKAAKEHKNLAVLYEQSVETKDQIRTAFYKTCQELENCTRDVSLLSRGIDDCRSNTKALVWDFEDVHNTNASAFVYDPKTSNELKLGALKDLQQKVQGIFQTIDAKFENFQISLDKFEDLKKVFEIHLNSIQSEVECLETKLQEDAEIRQELGLLCKTDGCKQGINPMSQHPSEDLVEMRMAKSKLILAGDILREIVNLVDWLGLLEKNYKTLTSLRRKINVRRNEIHTLEADNEQLQIKKSLAYNKFNAIKNLLSGLFSSEEYWNAREENRCLKIQSISTLLKEKMDKVSVLEAQRNTAEASLEKELEILAAKEAEMAFLREKLSLADQQRIDAEKAVTQLEKQTGPSSDLRSSAEQISLNLGTAASLLRGEEERNNLINSLKISYEQLQICKRKTEKLKAELKMSDSLIEQLQSEIDLISVGLKEAEHSSQKSSSEKESLTDFQTEVMTGVENSVLELQTVEFEVLCKEEELRSSQEELQELTAELAEAENSCQWNETLHAKQDIKSGLLCQLILGKIENVKTFLAEADASLDFQENVQ